MAKGLLPLVLAFGICVPSVNGAVLEGPGRFCGYAPILDLLPGEKITTLEGGIHGGRFEWVGPFGTLEVSGIGWAAKPRGHLVQLQRNSQPARFAQRRADGRYVVAIWNGAQGAAYFWSNARMTKLQIEAIDRVRLYQEGEEPEGCKLRTVFIWDFPESIPEKNPKSE